MMRLLLLFLLAGWATEGRSQGFFYLGQVPDAARAAMGETSLGQRGNVFSAVGHPAALAFQQSGQFGATYRSWISGERIYTIAAAFPSNRGRTIALHATTYDSSPPEELTGDEVRVPSGAYGISAAQMLGVFAVGGGVRFLNERTFGQNASGFAFDASVGVRALKESVEGMVAVQQLGWTGRVFGFRPVVPITVRGGMAVVPLRWTDARETSLVDLRLVGEVVRRIPYGDEAPEPSTEWHLGAELRGFDLLRVRAGWISGDPARSYTLGGGITYGRITGDYAWQPLQAGPTVGSHVLSIRYFY